MANDDLDFIDINNNINDIGGNDDIIFDSKNKGVFKKISYATSKLSAAISDVYETVDEEAEIEEARIAATILSGGSPLIAHFLEKGIQKYVPKLKNSVLMLKRKASDYIFKKKKIDEYDKELDNISKSDIDQDEFENKLGKLTDKFEELKVSKSTKRPGRRKTVTNLKIEKPIVKRYETSGLDKIEKSQTFNLNEMFEIRRNKLSGPTSFKRLIAKNNKYPFGDFIANKLGEINESIIDVGNKFSDLKDILLKSKDKIVNKKIDKERATTSNQMLESLNKIYDAINELPKKTSMDQTENFSAVATAARTNLTAQSGMFVRQSILKKAMMTPGLIIPGAKNGLISGSEFQGFLTAQVVQQLYWLNKAMGKFFGAKEPMFVDYLASGYETAMIAVSARLPIIKQLNHIVGFSMAIAKQLNRVGKILYSPIKLLLPGKRLKYSKEISMKSTPMETLVDIGMYQYNKLSMLYDLMARVYPKKSKDIRDKEWFSRIPGITPLASGMMGIAKYLFGEKQEKKKGSGLLDSIRNIPKSIKGFFLGSETSRTKSFSELSVRNKQLQIQYNSLMHLSSIDSHIKELVKSNIPGLKVKPEEYDDIRKYLEQEKTLKFKKGPSRLGAATMKVVSPIASVSSKLVSFMQKSRTITPQYDENRKTKSILTEEEKRKAEDAKIKIGVLKRTKEWFSKPTVMGNSVLLGLSLLNPIAYTAINSIWAMGLLGQFTGIKEFKVFDDLYNETAIMTGIHTKKLLSLVSDTPSKLKNLFNFKLRKPRKFNFVEKTTDGKKLSKADKLLTAIKENTKALPKRIADASRVAMGGIGAYAIYKVMGSMKSIFGNTPMAKSWVTISGGIAAYLATKDIGAALNVLQIGAIGGGLLFIFEKLKPLLGSKGALVATGAVGVGGAIATGMIGKKVLTTIGGWIGGLFAGSGIASTVTSGISAAGGVLLSGPALIALAVGGSVAGLAYYMKHKSEKDAEREIKRAKQDSEDRNKLLGVNQELLKQFGKQEGKYKISSIAAKAGIRSERTTTNLKELLSEKEEKRKGIIGKTLFRYKYNKEIKEILGEIEKSETSTKSMKELQSTIFNKLKSSRQDIDITGSNKIFIDILEELKKGTDVDKGTRKGIEEISKRFSTDMKSGGPLSQWSLKGSPDLKNTIALYGSYLTAMGANKNQIKSFLSESFSFFDGSKGKMKNVDLEKSLTYILAKSMGNISGKELKFKEREVFGKQLFENVKSKFEGLNIKGRLKQAGKDIESKKQELITPVKELKGKIDLDTKAINRLDELNKKAKSLEGKWLGGIRKYPIYQQALDPATRLMSIEYDFKKGKMSKTEYTARMGNLIKEYKKRGHITNKDIADFVKSKIESKKQELIAPVKELKGKIRSDSMAIENISNLKNQIESDKKFGHSFRNSGRLYEISINSRKFLELESMYKEGKISKPEYVSRMALALKKIRDNKLATDDEIKEFIKQKLPIVAEISNRADTFTKRAKENLSSIFKEMEEAKYKSGEKIKEAVSNTVTAIKAQSTTIMNQIKSSNSTVVSNNSGDQGSQMGDLINEYNKVQGYVMQGEI